MKGKMVHKFKLSIEQKYINETVRLKQVGGFSELINKTENYAARKIVLSFELHLAKFSFLKFH